MESEPKKVPKTACVFGDSKSNQTRKSLYPSFIQTILSAPEFHRIMPETTEVVTTARGLYHRSGIHVHVTDVCVTLPRRLVLSCYRILREKPYICSGLQKANPI